MRQNSFSSSNQRWNQDCLPTGSHRDSLQHGLNMTISHSYLYNIAQVDNADSFIDMRWLYCTRYYGVQTLQLLITLDTRLPELPALDA
jgi:hypothetical protein